MEIKVLGLNRHKNVAGLNQLMGPQSSSVDNWISTSITDINKQTKTCTHTLPLKKVKLHKNITFFSPLKWS